MNRLVPQDPKTWRSRTSTLVNIRWPNLTVDFDATEAGQQVGRPAMDERAAIELGEIFENFNERIKNASGFDRP
jgi:hypothetical protein